MLTVLDMEYTHYENGKHRVICTCKCDCGKIVKVNDGVLKKPGLHSCGCAKREIADKTFAKDITGKTFGRLTVVEEYKDCTPRKIRCVCSCGNETIVTKVDVMCGHTQSCGCLHREITFKINEKDWTGYIFPNGIKTIGRDRKNAHGAWLWKFICPLCGNVFSALPAIILESKTVSCGCSTMSSGEQIIDTFLKENLIPYSYQYTFDDCVNINKLRFDFGILDNDKNLKCLIEYNGQQHYEPIDYFGGDAVFQSQQKRDAIKADYCKTHNIPLYILDYTLTYDEIINQLTNIINA